MKLWMRLPSEMRGFSPDVGQSLLSKTARNSAVSPFSKGMPNNPPMTEGYRGVGFSGGEFRAVKWRGPGRDTFEEAQDDIDEHAAENPAASLTYHVLKKGEPHFKED